MIPFSIAELWLQSDLGDTFQKNILPKMGQMTSELGQYSCILKPETLP